MNETVVIDAPEGIARYQMMVAITRLHMEVKTGMRSRVSTLAFVKQAYGCPKGSKKGALEWMLNHYEATYGETVTLP